MSSKTPFFQAFGPLLFGRPAQRVMKKVRKMDSLQELYEIFGHLLPERLLAPSDEGVNSRKRIFSSRVTFWAFAAQVLNYHLLTKPRKEMKIHGDRNRPKVKHPKTSLS